jgi:hypothetical protein
MFDVGSGVNNVHVNPLTSISGIEIFVIVAE